MRLVATKSIQTRTTLAKTIYNENGRILLQKGVELTDKMITRLIQLNITYVYISDSDSDDIMITPPITDELRVESYRTIKSSFAQFQKEGLAKKSFVFEKTGRKMANIVKKILNQLQSSEEVLSILSDILINDDYIFTHSLNVTIYSLALGTELRLTEQQLEEIGLGAILHDVGKVFLPTKVIQKKGELTDEEFEIIKGHTEAGFEFLRKIPNIPLVSAHCAFQHHERLDGSGYPRALKDCEIHFYAKLITIADVFDAVTSNRVYRDAMLPHEGMEILYAGVGTLYDKKMVEAFRRSIAVYPNGLKVQLSDGRSGVVLQQNKHLCDRPIIRILQEDGKDVEELYELDLAETLNIVIAACETTFQ
ncbi:HD-GYP domain-containing protein [Aquibacillus sp. 3ASR75-11]|uniref:HD-GYP domain-containing protein n=1 Tax=Terrihalobacillus insolitus TaxID=2950438 RepID=A0A9X3WND7_9BACI|nr:HD-GYP domain-containing protein [Terrihalobacillus insolitus]MDC3412350.1 HD-GYP domain-containing protein [Terrihalobacillus insolitus]MDC3422957.1 HD-GYP domain-containing protein [Terrihalobacillus insolitus]